MDFHLPLKIRRLWPVLNPQTWVPKGSTLPLDHRTVDIMGRLKPSVRQHFRRVKHLKNVTLIHMFTFRACLTNKFLKTTPKSLCKWEFVHREVEPVLCFTTVYYEDMNIHGRFLQNVSPNEYDLNFACMKCIYILSCFSGNRFKPPGIYVYHILYYLIIQRLTTQCICFFFFPQWTANIFLDLV